MILPLIAAFVTGTAASAAVALERRRQWMWVGLFLNLLIAGNEISFVFRPIAEWIRIDLLLTLPVFAIVNFAFCAAAYRAGLQAISAVLALSVLAIPAFLLTRG